MGITYHIPTSAAVPFAVPSAHLASYMRERFSIKQLLWVDGIAALSAGITVLILQARLATLFNIPEVWLVISAIVSLGYSSYSICLAQQKSAARELIKVLAVANFVYAAYCLILALSFSKSATWVGVAYLLIESLFVATLAIVEWQHIKSDTEKYSN